MTEEQKIEECKKCEEYLNNWKRERADFLNYKKDEIERILSLVKHSTEKFVLNLLPILDNIYLAEKHLPENDEFKNGFLQIKKQLEEFLRKEGIEEIKSVGEKFDPNFMEVVGEADQNGESPSSAESGAVAEEIQKGYTMNGRVLRPAKVKITK
jgi:molecular chaperone GrpE